MKEERKEEGRNEGWAVSLDLPGPPTLWMEPVLQCFWSFVLGLTWHLFRGDRTGDGDIDDLPRGERGATQAEKREQPSRGSRLETTALGRTAHLTRGVSSDV